MVNPEFEVNRLRQTLIVRGISQEDAQTVADLALQDINRTIGFLVEKAVEKAKVIAEDIADPEITSQIRGARIGGSYELITDSGKTDFTLPPFPMLPHLLKNPKIAKDGSLYKVIPMKKRTMSQDSLHQDMNQSNRDAVDVRNTQRQEGKSKTLGINMVGLTEAKRILGRKVSSGNKSQGTATEFRTASSKQNPATSWVLPEKKMDIGPLLRDISDRLETDIQNAVLTIVSEYERAV
jgi:hypothetical protein